MKPIVHYVTDNNPFIAVGKRVLVTPVDHPSPLVSNTKLVLTSEVLSYNQLNGEFETQNTYYKPLKENK